MVSFSNNSLTLRGAPSTDAQQDPSTRPLPIPETNRPFPSARLPPHLLLPFLPRRTAQDTPPAPTGRTGSPPAGEAKKAPAPPSSLAHARCLPRLSAEAPALSLPLFRDASSCSSPGFRLPLRGRSVRAPGRRAMTSPRGRTRPAVGGRERV